MSDTAPQPSVSPSSGGNTLSPLATSLKQLGLPESVISQFESQGFYDLVDLGSTESKVREKLETINGLQQPTKDAIVRLWKHRYQELNESSENTPLNLPKLSPGTKIDLSTPTVRIDGANYEIPFSLQHALSGTASGPDGAPIVSAIDLTPEQWLVIAKRNNLCHAINLDRSFDQNQNPLALKSALVWNVPDPEELWADTDQPSRIENQTSYTSAMSARVHSRIIDASFSLQTPFVAALAKVNRDEKNSQSASTKRLYMTGKWVFPRVKLNMRLCTVLSPKFTKAVEEAVSENHTDQEKFTALRNIFSDFGHALPEYITLGGMMFFTYEKEVSGSINEQAVSNTIQAGVTAKVGASQGGGEVSFTDASGQKTSADEMRERTAWECVGGDETLTGNPSLWVQTVKTPDDWKIIERQGLFPITDFLEESLQNRVLSVWEKGLEELWGAKPPVDYTFPDFNGHPFRICKGLKSDDHVLTHRIDTAGSYPPPPIPHFCCIRYDDIEEIGFNKCLWKLIYSGQTDEMDGKGSPLYWIVPNDLGVNTKSEINDGLKEDLLGGYQLTIPILCSSVVRASADSDNDKMGFLYACSPAKTEFNRALTNQPPTFPDHPPPRYFPLKDWMYYGDRFVRSMLWTIHPKPDLPNAYIIRNHVDGRFMSSRKDPITDFRLRMLKDNAPKSYRDAVTTEASYFEKSQPIELTDKEEEAIIYCLVQTL